MRQLQIVNAAELAIAYAAAEYAVMLDGDTLPLRVGQPAADLEAYWPAERYVFITAWNPASKPHSEAVNETADLRLVAHLDENRTPRQAAWAECPSGDWREPGWLVTGLDSARIDALAQAFGQVAVLAWERGQPVRLRMLVDRPGNVAPRDAGVPDCIDWANA